MGFVSVDKMAKAPGNAACISYFRLSRWGDCSLSRPFLESRDEPVESIEFEIDPETGAFRFRLGEGYAREIKNQNFSIPGSAAKIIWDQLVRPVSSNFTQRSLYCKIIPLADGWYSGEFGSYTRPALEWPKEGKKKK